METNRSTGGSGMARRLRGGLESLGIGFRTESGDAAVGLPKGFEPFEDGLAIVKDGRCRMEFDRARELKLAWHPTPRFTVLDRIMCSVKMRPNDGSTSKASRFSAGMTCGGGADLNRMGSHDARGDTTPRALCPSESQSPRCTVEAIPVGFAQAENHRFHELGPNRRKARRQVCCPDTKPLPVVGPYRQFRTTRQGTANPFGE